MVLVDTSVWVSHFRSASQILVELAELDLIITHSMVIAEIACGTPPVPRLQTLADIALLKPATSASLSETRSFIEREQLYGLGCGIVDLMLLASTLLTPNAQLWTLDRRLAALAERFQVSFRNFNQ